MLVSVTKLLIKKESYYKEFDEQEREAFKEIEGLDESLLVYVDESGCDEYYHRDYGRAPAGGKIYGEV